jgi:hypothetical protein
MSYIPNTYPMELLKESECFCLFRSAYTVIRGTRERSWLRHYATNRKIGGSSPDVVDIFLICLILPAELWSCSGGKGLQARKADKLTAICEPIV